MVLCQHGEELDRRVVLELSRSDVQGYPIAVQANETDSVFEPRALADNQLAREHRCLVAPTLEEGC